MARKKGVTGAQTLEDAARGEVLALSGWTADRPFYARVRRASLTGMIRLGRIPNPLMSAAQRLFEGAGSRAAAGFEDVAKVVQLVAREALVEPTAQELDAMGLELTEQQVAQLYNYALRGVTQLRSFRADGGDDRGGDDGEGVGREAERAAGD